MVRMQPSRYELVSAESALETILALTPILGLEDVPLDEAPGRVLGENVLSTENVPAFDASMVDGYAVIAEDDSPSRDVLAEITAGRIGGVVVRPGTAARVMTGAPLPVGANAVAMVEDAEEANRQVRLSRSIRRGENVQPRGADLAVGQLVLEAGTVLGAPEIGLLATLGRISVKAYRRPRIAVMATGDELVDVAEQPGAGAIRDSNRPALVASIRESGGVPVSLGIVRDDEAEQTAKIQMALDQADVLVTSGGVSVGSRDLIKPILERLGQVHFGRVAVKPGKPLTFATVGPSLVFGLPGNPVSTLVTFEVFVRPALLKMQGRRWVLRPKVEVILEHDVKPSPDRTEYQRAVIRWDRGRLTARTTGSQASSRLLSMVGANGLVVVPPGEEKVSAGSTVPALLTGQLLA